MAITQKLRTLRMVIVSHGLGGFALVVLRKLIPPGNFILNWDQRVIVKQDASRPLEPSSATALTTDDSALLDGCNGQHQQSITAAFERGEKPWALVSEQCLQAYVWISGFRRINYSDTGYPLPEGYWWRDAFVAPDHRGKGHLAQLYHAWRAINPDAHLWSEIDPSNQASIKAHAKLGFREQSRLTMLCLLGLRLYRVRTGTQRHWVWRFAPRNLYLSHENYG